MREIVENDFRLQDVLKTPEDVAIAKFLLEKSFEGYDYIQKPVMIDEFILSDRYLDLKQVIRPVVLEDMKDLFCDESAFAYCPYEEAVFNEAIGTGKSFKSSIISSYYLYHLQCLYSPLSPFSLDEGSMIAIMNMSVNSKQAKNVVFGEIKSRILNSQWFQGERGPDPTIMSELRFNKIGIIPANSSTTFPLGYNLLVGIMDEAAFYTETEEHDVAEEIFYTLKRRIQSRFGNRGLLVMISSPRYVDDFIERKSKEAENESYIFSRRHKIWEVVPEDIKAIKEGKTFELGGENIPLKYQKDFEKNPDNAWRDLGGLPSLALEPFMKNMTAFNACIVKEVNDTKLYHPFDDNERLLSTFRCERPMRKHYIHVDLGLTHDACGLAMGYVDGELSVINLMLKIKPKKGSEIDIQGVIDLIKEIKMRGFRVSGITYDQFQSASSIQELRKLGFSAGRQSVEGLEVYETMKEEIYQGHARFYNYTPFNDEVKRLELVKGKKVDHPPKGSKDVSDGVAGVMYQLVTKEKNRRVASVSVV